MTTVHGKTMHLVIDDVRLTSITVGDGSITANLDLKVGEKTLSTVTLASWQNKNSPQHIPYTDEMKAHFKILSELVERYSRVTLSSLNPELSAPPPTDEDIIILSGDLFDSEEG